MSVGNLGVHQVPVDSALI